MTIILRECWKTLHTPRTQLSNTFLEDSRAPVRGSSLALNGTLQGPGTVVVAVETSTYPDNVTVGGIILLHKALIYVAT
jgi:hypothetical protein